MLIYYITISEGGRKVSEEQQPQYVREEWVYIGLYIDSKGKKSYGWANVENLEVKHWFGKQLVSASVGHLYYIYVIHKEGGSLSVRTSGVNMPQWFGKYDDKEQIKLWAIADEASKQQASTKSMNTKASKEAPLDEIYDDLRRVGRQLNTTEKLALIAKLSEIILRA